MKRVEATLLAVLGLAVAASAGHAEMATFADFPTVVYCENLGVTHAYYFSRLGTDGVAVYLTPDDLAGAVTIDGVAMKVGGEAVGSCADKALDDLRASGQAVFLAR